MRECEATITKKHMVNKETEIMDSRASLSCGGLNDELIQMGESLSKTYIVPMEQIVLATKRAKLVHDL